MHFLCSNLQLCLVILFAWKVKAVFPRFPPESIAPINLSPCGDTKLSDISTKKCACVNKSNAFSISNHNYSPGSSSLNILPEALSLNHRNFRNSGVIGNLLLYLLSHCTNLNKSINKYWCFNFVW